MKKLLVFAASILLSASSFAHLGNGSSGGGNIYGNQLNPWFIQNTKDVTYCVEISPEFGDVSRERILELINSSFMFWKKTFQNHYTQNYSMDLKITLGTQNFNYSEECSNNTDIKFLLGSLSDEQIASIPNLNQVLGLARRTSYDEVNLKGKGFIYLAPESGNLRPHSSNLHPQQWSVAQNNGLEHALLHEIGHIFGLQDHYYSLFSLMSAGWIESRTRKDALEEYQVTAGNGPSPLGCNVEMEGDFTTYFASMSEGRVEGNKLRIKSSQGVLTVTLNDEVYGSIKLRADGVASRMGRPAVNLYLTPSQKVFGDIEEGYYYSNIPVVYALDSVRRESEILKLSNGEELKVFIQFDEICHPTIGTIRNGEVDFDIFLN